MAAPAIKKILLIEDSPNQHQLIKQMVSRFANGPWELEIADTYAVGLKKLLSSRHYVCLLDCHLDDGKDGLELLRAARSADVTTPVIVMTADTGSEIDEAAMEAGAMDFLVKAEFTPVMLERSIRYARKLGGMLQQLRQQATRDELTGLSNRREFDRQLHEEWQRIARFQRSCALVLIDIDFFKKVNDTYGHQIGDQVLKHVASLLAGQVRTVDRLARYGGEEFGLIVIESNRAEARETVERLRILLQETPCFIPEKNLTVEVTISAGIAAMPEDADNLDQLIEAADAALYSAKRLGRNRVVTTKMRASGSSHNPLAPAKSSTAG
ncbi:MAG TPA: GGDEF domain-containing response regulator [Candidatus Didemnitutus sp.]|nr:GGDEF domain-containing response regulator [Candidatus Didemnitutus sp.]